MADKQNYEENETSKFKIVDGKRTMYHEKEIIEDGTTKEYDQKDLKKYLDVQNKYLEEGSKIDANGSGFEQIHNNGNADLKNFVAGSLNINPNGYNEMVEFINVFGTKSNGSFTAEGQAAHDKLMKLIEEQKAKESANAAQKNQAPVQESATQGVSTPVAPTPKKPTRSIQSSIENKKFLAALGLADMTKLREALEKSDLSAGQKDMLRQKMQSNAQERMVGMMKNGIDKNKLDETEKFVNTFVVYNQKDKAEYPYASKLRQKIADEKTKQKAEKDKITPIVAVVPVAGKETDGKTNLAPVTGNTDKDKAKKKPVVGFWGKLKNKAKQVADAAKRNWKKIALIAALAAAALLPKTCSEKVATPLPDEGKDKKETPAPTPAPDKSDTIAVEADSIGKAYYDSALKIHLGEEKRDALYATISQRSEEGNIKLGGGVSVERFAHSMTMYKLNQPSNEINSLFEKALDGKTNPVENVKLSKAVHDAGAMGDGVVASGKHSNYDQQTPSVKKHHNEVASDFRDAGR